MGLVEVWQRKTDEELRYAASELETFTPEARQVIVDEMRRRGLGDQAAPEATPAGPATLAAPPPVGPAGPVGGLTDLRLRRLQSDYEAVRRLAHLHPRIEVESANGNPPDRYLLRLKVRSVRQQGEEVRIASHHRLEVVLPSTYPRDAPLCRMLTPVFHPNIAPHAVCVGDHWTAGEALDLMIQRIGEMLAFQSYNVKSPLNGKAARWVEENRSLLPTDRTEFFIDLASATPLAAEASAGCANCGAAGQPLVACEEGHELCPDCVSQCTSCGRPLCLVCGVVACPSCTLACSNCESPAVSRRCAQGHWLCDDCSARCESCGRELCLPCGDVPCPDCRPAEAPAGPVPSPDARRE